MLVKSTFTLLLVLFIHSTTYAKSEAVVVYAADLPIIGTSAHGDYAELATLLKRTRAEAQNTPHFFLFGGASLAPSPLASFDSGSHIVDVLNMLEPDAMSVAKREFSYFEDELTLRSYEAAFPFVLSNTADNETGEYLDGVFPSLILSKQGFSIGVLSILHPRVSEEYLLQRLMIRNPKNTVIRLTEQLRNDGADIIVLLHSDYFPFINAMLKQETIDLAIQSAPHDVLKLDNEKIRHANSVLINDLGTAAVINVAATQERLDVTVNLVELASEDPDPDVSQTIINYKSRLKTQLDRPIGPITKAFSTVRGQVRTTENGFANILADAMRLEANTQLAIINGGSIRGNRNYQSEQVFKYGDLLDELPFRSRMVVLDVTGKQLKAALENGASQIENIKGKFAQVSGLSYSISPLLTSGERISNIKVNNESLELSKTYTLATTDYLANGGDGYTALQQSTQRFDKSPTSPLISDVLARYLMTRKSVSPYQDGRIKIVGKRLDDS